MDSQQCSSNDFMLNVGNILPSEDRRANVISRDRDGKSYWRVNEANWGKFLINYCVAASDDNVPDINEVVGAEGPISIKMKLVYDVDDDHSEWSRVNNEFLMSVVSVIQSVMREAYVFTSNAMSVCVAMKSNVWEDASTSNICLRFHFPYTHVKYADFFRNVQPIICRKLNTQNCLSLLERHPNGDWSSIISPPEKERELYGSCVIDTPDVYCHLVEVWNDLDLHNLNEYDISTKRSVDIVTAFHAHYHCALEDEEDLEDEDSNPNAKEVRMKYLPIYLSTGYYGSLASVNAEFNKGESLMEFDMIEHMSRNAENDIPNELSICEILASMINVNRLYNKNSWVHIGMAFRNACPDYKTLEVGLRKWMTLVKNKLDLNNPKSDKIIPEFMTECDGFDNTFRHYYYLPQPQAYTHRTLAMYAKSDSPEEYERWREVFLIDGCMTMTGKTTSKVAIGAWRYLYLDTVSDPSSGQFYKFIGNCWIKDESKSELNDDLYRMAIHIKSLCVKVEELARDHSNPHHASIARNKASLLHTIATDLENHRDRKNFNQALLARLRLRKVESMFNKNFKVLGVSNGVLDLQSGEPVFRPGMAEDYILDEVCPAAFRKDYTWESVKVKQMMKLIEQFFPDHNVRHYALKFIASTLEGGNPYKLLTVFTGNTNAGKTTLISILEDMYGNLLFKYPPGHLSNTPRSDAPSPQLAQAVGARIGVIDEIPPGTKAEPFKREASNDSGFSRKCRENGGKNKPSHKLIVQTNGLGRIEGMDYATLAKLVLIPFISAFDAHAPESEEEQIKRNHYPVDVELSSQFVHLSSAMLWIAVQYFPLYKSEGLAMPNVMVKEVENYVAKSDPYKKFAVHRIVPAGNPDDEEDRHMLTVQQAYDDFTIWFRHDSPSSRVPSQGDFLKGMSRRDVLGEPDEDSYWIGCELKYKRATRNEGKSRNDTNDIIYDDGDDSDQD